MRPNLLVLPIAAAIPVRAFLALSGFLIHWIKALAKARRHRRQAHALAALDRRMLGDMGLTRADVADAFSSPFWEDPTALLRERALDRRLNRSLANTMLDRSRGRDDHAFSRPRIDRPARHTI